ncbi:unnamed protein product [Allacma fusca]|uniref:RING-type E3 ubiquitin transferase n=1 Tax=Allacma fusca TaxID=39272 RepID=A0A8J2P0E4_9HEXA|nr:unnamed protein product [Allacma fusca]
MAAGGTSRSVGFLGLNESEVIGATGSIVSKRYECPVCLDALIPPIYQCHNGHIFCNNCEPKLVNCPICRESLSRRKIRTLALEEIILEMSFDCKSKDLGCQASLKPLEMEEHEYQCKYTKHYFCKILKIDCNHESSVRDVIEHFRDAHRLTGVDMTNLGTIEKRWVEIQQQILRSEFETLQNKVGFAPHYFIFEGHRFLLSTKLDLKKKSIAWRVTVLGGKSVSSQFTVKMKLVVNSTSSSEVLKWHGNVADLKVPTSPHCLFEVRMVTLEKFLKSFTSSCGWSLYLKFVTDAPKRKIPTPGSAVLETETFRCTHTQETVAMQPYTYIPELHLPDGFRSTVFGAGHGSPFHCPWDQGYSMRPSRAIGMELGRTRIFRSSVPTPSVIFPSRNRP